MSFSESIEGPSGVWAGIGGIVLFLSLLMSCAFIKHKTRKTKEDILQCEKHIISVLAFGVYAILRVIVAVPEREKTTMKDDLQKANAFIINLMILLVYLIHSFSAFEKYLTYKYPNHLFNSIIYAYKGKLWYEGILFFFVVAFCVLVFVSGIEENIIWTIDKYLWPFLLVISIIALVFGIITLRLFRSFEFRNKEKLIKVLAIDIFVTVLYFLKAGASIYNGAMLYQKKDDLMSLITKISMYSTIILCILDYIINFYMIGYSTFCQLKLGKSCIGFFLRCFLRNKIGGFLEEDFMISSSGPKEKNRIHACYDNDYFFEDYQIDFIDEIFNVTCSSLYKVYQDKSIYSLSPVGLGISHDLGKSTTSTKLLTNPCKEFEYNKGDNVDDFKDKSSICNEYLKVTGTAYFTDECNELLRQRNINIKQISNSLVSHMKDNGFGGFLSLIGHNASDQAFKTIPSFSLKSLDRDYVMEYYNQFEDKKKEKLNDVMVKYFNYMRDANGSFLPLVVGIIELQINSFGSILLVISRNPIVENSPKISFNYWQLIRFGETNFEKVSSSKCSNNLLIDDDCIFDRKFKVDSDNTKAQGRIVIKNKQDIFDTTKSDLLFLRKIQSKQFNLIMMYYEFGIDANPEKMGLITESVTNNNMQLFALNSTESKYLESQNIQPNIMGRDSNAPDIKFGDISIIGSGIPGKKQGNMIDFADNISIYGYEGTYDQFKCLCFFSFENIFDFRKRMVLTNFYTKYHEKVMSAFTDFS